MKGIFIKMKQLYFLKGIDSLGRVVVPKNLRKQLNISSGDHVEMCLDGDKIIIKKHNPSCVFCNSSDYIVNYKGTNICSKCHERIKLLFAED